MEASQSALKEYSAKASEMIGGAKQAAVEKGYASKETVDKVPGGGVGSGVGSGVGNGAATEPALTFKQEDFPSAPVHPVGVNSHDGTKEESEPLLA